MTTRNYDLVPFTEAAWHNILAKPDESLIKHTWYVLSRLGDQVRLHPSLPTEIGEPHLWHWLYWGTFLHDFGKCASGFQDVLKTNKRSWGFRHEALSLAFVDWLFPRGNPHRSAVIAVIACHHKDAEEIICKYGNNPLDEPDEKLAPQMIAQVTPTSQRILYHWLSACGHEWANISGFAPFLSPITLPDEIAAATPLQPSAIYHAISDLQAFTVNRSFQENGHAAHVGSLLRGMILIADHAGSAESKREPFAALALPAPNFQTVLIKPEHEIYPHQNQSAESAAGSVMLIAPTGSGKTESALLWLNRQADLDKSAPARMFYILPYQASMNAMYLRLQKTFGKSVVGLQHGHAQQAIYAIALSDELSTASANTAAKINEEISSLHRYPINVQSPYQMLKVPYQMKGHEAIFTSFQGGRFVFDEIHAYEPDRLALIVRFIGFLRNYANARFFIMSATLPQHVREVLHDAIPDLQVIEATAQTFEKFQRHIVHVLPGSLSDPDTLDRIEADAVQGQSVLVCCNTVQRAKDMHALIQLRLPDHPIILVHSRFNSRDRSEKERQIMGQVGVEAKDGYSGRKPIVIATQVIEVSLNIDMDTLYTEAAPLEALLQRFGRVNRSRPEKTLAQVYVLREQPENVKHIYKPPELLEATLTILESSDGIPIDEVKVNDWLTQVYTPPVLEYWWSKYRESAERFDRDILGTLRPFATDREIEKSFYQMFDGVEVLPESDYETWQELIDQQKFLEASRLLVPLRWDQYVRLRNKQKAWSDEEKPRKAQAGRYKMRMFFADVPYSSESGLDIEAAFQAEAPPEAD